MLPSSGGGLLGIVFLLLPGIAYELSYQRRGPERRQTVFVEGARVIVAGTLISAVTLTALLLAGRVKPGVRAGLSALAKDVVSEDDVVALLAFGIIFAILASTAGTLLGHLVPWLRGTALDQRNESSWIEVFHRAPEQIGRPSHKQLVVRLDGGRTVVGTLHSYNSEQDMEQRELVLESPLGELAEDGTVEVIKMSRVIISGKNIRSIDVRYIPPPQGKVPDSGRESRSSRALRSSVRVMSSMSGLAVLLFLEYLSLALWAIS